MQKEASGVYQDSKHHKLKIFYFHLNVYYKIGELYVQQDWMDDQSLECQSKNLFSLALPILFKYKALKT